MELLRHHPQPVLSAIGAPDVLVHFLSMHAQILTPKQALTHAVPHLLCHLAHHPDMDGLPEAILWDAPIRAIADLHHGMFWDLTPPAKAMVADKAGLELELQDGQRASVPRDETAIQTTATTPTLAYPSLTSGHSSLHLCLKDTNPLSMNEAHPDKQGNAVDLAGHHSTKWCEALNEALEMIATHLPHWHAELSLTLQRLIPVGYHPERHLSASYREAPTVAYLTLHPDPLTLAEAIVHETQHGKLNSLSWLDPVLHNGMTEWTESPVRPDLRPLWGVLLAVHAFVPVAALHARLAEANAPLCARPSFTQRRWEVLDSNRRGLDVLNRLAKPTPSGRRILGELSVLNEFLIGEAPLPPPHLIRTERMPC